MFPKIYITLYSGMLCVRITLIKGTGNSYKNVLSIDRMYTDYF